MKIKKRQKKIGNKNPELEEYGRVFGSDENFAFIAGFTSNGAPFGITHEEMRELENEQDFNKNDDLNFPF
jgi:hypothetical protein